MFPQADLLAWYGKTKPNTTKTHSPIKKNVQHKINTNECAAVAEMSDHFATTDIRGK